MSPIEPTTLSIAIATAIFGGLGGYFFAQASSLGLFGPPTKKGKRKAPKRSWPNSYDVTVHPDSSDEELMAHLNGGKAGADSGRGSEESEETDGEDGDDDEEAQDGLRAFDGSSEEHKLVLVVRTDLGMGKGKITAQASHATIANYMTLLRAPHCAGLLQRWASRGQSTVVVQAKSEEELLTLQAQAMSLGLCARVIHDAGRTQIAAGSATVLGVGPGPKSVVDGVTGGLKLL